jgi:hypothetical protein
VAAAAVGPTAELLLGATVLPLLLRLLLPPLLLSLLLPSSEPKYRFIK